MLNNTEKIILTNASALLDECLTNLNLGHMSLVCWADSERELIQHTIEDLDWMAMDGQFVEEEDDE